MLNIFLYLLFISIAIFFIYKYYKNKNIEKKKSIKRKDKNKFISLLQDTYMKEQSLKQMCNISLNLIVNKFEAINASLYLFDETNDKLYLGATYGIKHDTLKHTLDLHENIISENVLHKEINVKEINQNINIGNIETNLTKLVTIPLLEFDKSIGTIQLTFDDRFNNIDIKFLQQSTSVIATYINKALQYNITKKYSDLINKNVLMSQTDLDGNIIQISEELCSLSKYTKDELIGKNHRIFRHEDMSKDFFSDMWETITKGTSWRGEIKNRTKDGTYYWIDTIISPDSDINGNVTGYTSISTNISDKKKIEEIAITDNLTSLYNKRYFNTMFSQQIDISRRSKTLLAFVLIDIDDFKLYNDTYGHQDGDKILKRVAIALKRTLRRPDDYTFRLGEDEFGLLFYITTKDDGIAITEIIRENIEKLHIQHSENSASPYITISLGLSVISPTEINNTEEIYEKTNKALHSAKNMGKNQISIA
ncbi:diguanylate cyclase domain-containing protein [Sulfurimonas sp.]